MSENGRLMNESIYLQISNLMSIIVKKQHVLLLVCNPFKRIPLSKSDQNDNVVTENATKDTSP